MSGILIYLRTAHKLQSSEVLVGNFRKIKGGFRSSAPTLMEKLRARDRAKLAKKLEKNQRKFEEEQHQTVMARGPRMVANRTPSPF